METQEVMAQVNSGLPPVAPRLPHKAPSFISPSLLAHIPASELVKGLIDLVTEAFAWLSTGQFLLLSLLLEG